MTTTTSYGSWNNHGDEWNLTVAASIADVVTNADRDWIERMQAAGAFDRIEGDYRAAIQSALPEGVWLTGNDFIGPYYEEDYTWEGELDIADLIGDIDLQEIVERHDIDMLPKAEV